MTKTNLNTDKTSSKRSLSRLMAVQTLYQYQYHNNDGDILELMDQVIDNYLLDTTLEDTSSYRTKIDLILLSDLLTGVSMVLDKVDARITKFLDKNHKLEQIPDILLQILRLGAFELQFMRNNPANVVINEYVNIADAFYDSKKVSFANAILDKMKNIEN